MIEYQSAVLFVKDIAVSRHFYSDLLEQKVGMDHGVNVGYEAGFAIWEANHARGVIHGQAQPDDGPLGRDNLELYFETGDLEAAWDRLAQAGVTVVHPLVEQPWGQRVFRVADPDGHIVELGEPMSVALRRMIDQGMTVEQAARKAAMPVEIVTLILQAPAAS